MCRNFDCNALLWRTHAFIVQSISETIMAISQSAWTRQRHFCKCTELMEFISVTYSWGRIGANFDQFMHLQFGLQLWALATAELSSWEQMGLDSIWVRGFQKKSKCCTVYVLVTSRQYASLRSAPYICTFHHDSKCQLARGISFEDKR